MYISRQVLLKCEEILDSYFYQRVQNSANTCHIMDIHRLVMCGSVRKSNLVISTMRQSGKFRQFFGDVHMGVSKNSGTPKSSILIGCSVINHPFWGTTIFGNTHIFSTVFKTKLSLNVM